MGDEASNLTYRVLEKKLSEQIQALYLTQLGHQPDEVDCHLVDKTLSIVVDNPVTQPERLLFTNGKQEFAELVRSNINKAFQPQLKTLIEEVVGVVVIDLLGDSKIPTGRTSIVAILAATPQKSDSSYSPTIK